MLGLARSQHYPALGASASAAFAAGRSAEEPTLRTVLNILWLVLAGFWLAVSYVCVGIVMCIFIITIPFGIASFRIAAFALWPFGRTAVPKPSAGVASAIGNVIWLVFAGIWLALGHLFTGLLLCLTIIGIPLGLANFKLIPISLTPLGYDIVPIGTVSRDRVGPAFG
ncbi:MAG: YccF domain-containing protein [Antricoccus sp.]